MVAKLLDQITYYIRHFRKHVICQTLWCHPFHWQFDIHMLCETIIFLGTYVHWQAKVCNLYDHIKVNPACIRDIIMIIIIMDNKKPYMQFLAARSLWTTFSLVRYSIPLATCRHMSISLFLMNTTYQDVENLSMNIYNYYRELAVL